MNDTEADYQKQLEKDIQEIKKVVRMMMKVVLYTSFVMVFCLTISAVIRGFMYGFT